MADAPTRVNFFDGMLLTGEDLRTEQEYCRRMRYLHNRLHGHGVVEGLVVTTNPKGHQVCVGAGWALDAEGREVVLAEPWCGQPDRTGTTDLVITWAEVAAEPVPGRPDDGLLHTRWVEQPELSFVPPGQAPEGGIVLARVKRRRLGRVTVDGSVRRGLGR